MWHFRTWFSRHSGDGLTVGLHDLRGLFQPEWFCDSVISSGHRPVSGLTFLSVMFKASTTATTNNAWIRFELADLSLNHQMFVGFPLCNKQRASSHRTGTHTPLKHLLDKLSSLSSLSSHWEAYSPALPCVWV